MADNLNIYKQCQQCGGTGTITVNNQEFDPGPPAEVECSKRNGTGKIYWGQMREEDPPE